MIYLWIVNLPQHAWPPRMHYWSPCRALLQELRGAGHLPSLKKSYFVCGSYACEKELRRLLTPEDIRIHRIGKDLGVPTTGARRRSTAGQKERLQKGVRRSNKLHALKVGPGKASSLYCFGPRLRRLGSPGTGVKPVRPQ